MGLPVPCTKSVSMELLGHDTLYEYISDRECVFPDSLLADMDKIENWATFGFNLCIAGYKLSHQIS
jgi:hypothetical protein